MDDNTSVPGADHTLGANLSREEGPQHVGVMDDLDDLDGHASGELCDLMVALRLDARRLLAEIHGERTRDRAHRGPEKRSRRGHNCA
jgi:hypothetical protein